MMVNLDKPTLDQFTQSMRGDVLLPDDPGYDKARSIWNGMIDRRPALIARCAGAADVRAAIAFAREQDLPLAVRGGGHNIAGNAVCNDGIVVDLSALRSVHVNPQARQATVEPGARLADFDREAQAYGLATPLGINSTTGVAGLTLGGGFGWLSRKFGLTVDNLLSADVVTADGRHVVASSKENPELFWALRGGGGNFGVVTRFEFKLHPVGPQVLCGLIVFPFEGAASFLRKYREFAAKIPTELNVWVVLRQAPPLPFLPESVHGKTVIVCPVFYLGDPPKAKRLLDRLRRFAPVLGENVGPAPYTAWQQAFDPLLTEGARNYWKSHNFAELADGAIDTTVAFAETLPSPQCEIFIGLLGGRVNKVATDATAYAQRDALFVMNVHARWDSAYDDTACINWARDFFNASAQFATGGVYVNFLTQDEADRVADAYGPNFARLQRAKREFDRDNVFRLNQNIAPEDVAA
jgi:FAD/FMN-containing dehydrogenase